MSRTRAFRLSGASCNVCFREGQQLARQVRTAQGALHGKVHAHGDLRLPALPHVLLHALQIADDDGEHVVKIVCDPAGQLAQRVDLLDLRQLLLRPAPVGDVQPGADDLLRPGGRADQHALVEDVAVGPVGALPAVFRAEGAAGQGRRHLRQDAVAVVGVDAVLPEVRPLREFTRGEAADPLDHLADELRAGRTEGIAGGQVHAVHGDGQRPDDRRLPLLHPLERLFGQLAFGVGPDVVVQQLLLDGDLPLQFPGLVEQVDEDGDLRPQHGRVHRLQHVVHRPGGIAPEEVALVLVHAGQEDDRHMPVALALPDHGRHLVAVQARQVHVQQDQREVPLQKVAQRLLPRRGLDRVGVQRGQRLFQREQVARIVVHQQDACPRLLGPGRGHRAYCRLADHRISHARSVASRRSTSTGLAM